MCSSKNTSVIDESTTTEIVVVNYDSSLPWELTQECTDTASDPVVLFIHRYMDYKI